MNEPKDIPKGWTAFCREEDKKVLGYFEFNKGGKYLGSLIMVSADTKDGLLLKLAELEYNI